MRKDRTRAARRALLALLVVVSGAVAWSLRRPAARPDPALPGPAVSPGQGTTVGEMDFLRFREGSRKVGVKARAMLGKEGDAMRLQGVEVTVPFVAQGRESSATITADECLYQPSPLRAAFRGNVRVRTDDGLELDSETLKYWGEEERAFTRDAVRFRRGGTSGTGSGMEYAAGAGLSLQGPVRVLVEDGAGPPAEVESASAWASREQRLVTFEGDVVVRQGDRVLRSRRLQLNLDPTLSAVERVEAIEDVDLVTRSLGPAAAPGEGGSRRLRCRRLDVLFREKGVLQEALAANAASLELEPGPGEPNERRRVAAPQLRFEFDEGGRLVSLQGLPARRPEMRAARRAVLTAEGLPPSPVALRRVESDRFTATLDPESGAVRGADFEGSVAFVEPGRKAWAGRAVLEEGAGLVTLTGDPRIADEGEGSELRGRRIELGTRSRNVAASGNVRHTLNRKDKPERTGLFGGGEPTELFCREFDYDSATRTARYRENAILRSGRDEVRAPGIVIDEPGPGRRRLAASGGTTSILHPRAGKGATSDPEPVEARSRDMVYEESARRIVYTGDVEIRQGDILTRSPEAVVTLAKDGGEVERMIAGEPVEVVQGARRATGTRGAYTPSDETFVLTGEKVVLQDVDRRLEGRVLTFQVGGDRIRVDGREEVRTEAVFKRKEPSKP